MDTYNIPASLHKKKLALVIGGSIAGLLAVRALSDYYDQVLVIERDIFPENAEYRPGVPQSRHLHRLLTRGRLILQRLFPGIIDDLLMHGAYPLANKKSVLVLGNEVLTYSFSEDIFSEDMICSRALLEWVIRQRVQRLPGVSFLVNREVIGLETTSDRTNVTGVYVRQHGQINEQEILKADLVVDASGSSSKIAHWLQDLGSALPDPERVDTALGYSSRYYQMPSGLHADAGMFLKPPTTADTFGAALQPIENNVWELILAGLGGHYPPTDAAEFEQQLLASGVDSQVFAPLQNLTPLTDPRGYRVPVCIRQHFEQMEQWPTGLLVVGDALCNFDPRYGQGMSVAASEAEILAACLQESQQHHDLPFERYVLQRMQEAIHPAWWFSTFANLTVPQVTYTGPSPIKGSQFLEKYLQLYMKYVILHEKDKLQTEEINQTYLFKYMMVADLVASPREIFNTSVLEVLLTSGEESIEQQVLTELFKNYPLSFKAILDDIVPSFEDRS